MNIAVQHGLLDVLQIFLEPMSKKTLKAVAWRGDSASEYYRLAFLGNQIECAAYLLKKLGFGAKRLDMLSLKHPQTAKTLPFLLIEQKLFRIMAEIFSNRSEAEKITLANSTDAANNTLLNALITACNVHYKNALDDRRSPHD